MDSVSQSALTGRNLIKFLIDGKEVMSEAGRALRSAERSIHIEVFQLQADHIGKSFADLLSAKARAGVKVRLLIDEHGSQAEDDKDLQEMPGLMRAGGIEIIVKKAPFLKNHLDHRKVVAIDGKVGFTGGMNIGRWYQEEWHDQQTLIVGPAAFLLIGLWAQALAGLCALNQCQTLCHNMGMRKILPAALGLIIASAAPLCASGAAFQDLLDESRGAAAEVPQPGLAPAPAGVELEMVQHLPPDNDEPGFEWPARNKGLEEHFFYIGDNVTFLKTMPVQASELQDGAGRCTLNPNTLYKARSKPGFEGEHLKVTLTEPLPGCKLAGGYIFMLHVASSSAGGAWELPKNVRAFLDTLAYAEGTDDYYNYIFTHATFQSYADHPRKRLCSGRLCSDAAGRYQFLSTTWDGLAPGLGLSDFTPPSQEKAVLELIRRGGAYRNVVKANIYENFAVALRKLNGTWASLPGSPYGQPTHSTAELWKFFKAALAKY